MISVWVTWFLLLVCLIVYSLLACDVFSVVILAIMIILPITIMLFNRVIKAKVSAEADIVNACEKNQTVVVKLKIKNDSLVSYRRVKSIVCIKNILTGECSEEIVKSVLYAKNAVEFSVKFKSHYCGKIQVSFKDIRLYDYFGFTYRNLEIDESYCVTVLPDIYSIHITLQSLDKLNSEIETYSEDKIGTDISEVYDFRDYAPGDSPKQIQWKLSQKYDRFIVRQGSLPVQNSVLLIFAPGKGEASAISTAAEIAVSVAQSFCESGVRFQLLWKDGIRHQVCSYYIENEEDLSVVLSALLCVETAELSDLLSVETELENIICVTSDESIVTNALSYQAIVLFSGELMDYANVISFTPKTLAEDLCEINICAK